MNTAGATRTQPTARLVGAWIGLVICTAGSFACLIGIYRGMRTSMIESGGFCASGGPYVVANQCNDSAIALLMISLLVGLLFAGGRAALNAWVDGPALGLFPSMGILFGVLGYNFMDLGLHPPEDMASTWGWILCGVIFWLMALGFMLPLVWEVRDWFDEEGSPTTAFTPQAFAGDKPAADAPPSSPTPARLVPPNSDEYMR